jgi:hypothetical protein
VAQPVLCAGIGDTSLSSKQGLVAQPVLCAGIGDTSLSSKQGLVAQPVLCAGIGDTSLSSKQGLVAQPVLCAGVGGTIAFPLFWDGWTSIPSMQVLTGPACPLCSDWPDQPDIYACPLCRYWLDQPLPGTIGSPAWRDTCDQLF